MNEHEEFDDRLNAALRALPREKAAAGFKGRVLARLAESAPAATPVNVLPFQQRGLRAKAPLWISIAAALLALVVGAREWQHRREQEEAMQRIAELRTQYEILADTMAELRGQAAAARPVVYVGGNQDVDLVFDLSRLAGDAEKASDKKPKTQQDEKAAKALAAELAKLIQEGGGEVY